MFDVNGRNIIMTAGDTGAVTYTANGAEFTTGDYALFTVKDSTGDIKLQRQYPMSGNAFTVNFHNVDTDTWTSGTYSYDVRYIFGAVFSGSDIVDGEAVVTPFNPATLTIIAPVGEV